jgi:predicted phosphodiesterase
MHGRLREIAVYDQALTDLEITKLFAKGSDLTVLPAVEDTRLWMLVQPYLQHVTRTGITVLWETSRPTSSLVRYGKQLPLTETITLDDPVNIHELRLCGLEPQTPYFYQVVSTDELGQELVSDVFTFQTAVEEGTPFSFTVLADTQASPEVVHALAEQCFAQRPNFTLIAGDLVSTGTSKTDWTSHFFPNMHPLIARAAFFPAPGNHDQDADWYYRYIAAPEPEYCYDFRYGNAHFFMIDTNRPVGPGNEQYAWLDERLAASEADWKFAAHHHPPYTSDENDYGDTWEGTSTQGDLNVRALAPLYEEHGVDIVFNGHIHVYERTWPIHADRVVEEGGVIYITTGGAGGGLENFAPSKAWFSNTVHRAHHYCYVAINGGALQFKAFDVEGRLFDSFSLKKVD